MPPYNRFPGEKVRYNQRQTSLYKSQRVRWIKGQTYRPNSVIYEQNGIRLFRYRSYRATDGFWETQFDPSGRLPGEPEEPGTGPVCGYTPGPSCLPDRLGYVRVQTSYSYTLDIINPAVEIFQQADSTDRYYIYPGGTNPPSDGTQLAVMAFVGEYTGLYPVGCVNGVLSRYQVSAELGRVVVGWNLTIYNESADKVYRYTFGHDVALGDTEYAADQATNQVSRTYGYTGSINAQFFFVNDTSGNDNSYCFPGQPGTPPTPDINRPLRYKCNCPDFTKEVEPLPWSRYTSELTGRAIVGNTHSGDNGPCKHIYSAAVATGERFADPASVRDPWTLQDYPPHIIQLDWLDPVPPTLNGDNNIEQLRQWREERRLRRRESYTQSTAAFQQRRAEALKKKLEYFHTLYSNNDQQRIDDLEGNDYRQYVEYRDRQNSGRQQWTQSNRNTHGYDDDGSGTN